jgi:hypothetical protein
MMAPMVQSRNLVWYEKGPRFKPAGRYESLVGGLTLTVTLVSRVCGRIPKNI